jgi:sterol 3beta-glucosyltransferase
MSEIKPYEDPKKLPSPAASSAVSHRDSIDFPERLNFGDDAHEDVTAPAESKKQQYMHQSIFSMITAASSKIDFNARFDDESSDSDEGEATAEPSELTSTAAKVRRKVKGKLVKALPTIGNRSTKDQKVPHRRQPSVPETSEGRDSSKPLARVPTTASAKDAPVMSRMVEATERYKKDELLLKEDQQVTENTRPSNTAQTSLSQRLMEIFGLSEPEEVQAGKFISFSIKY